MERVLGKPQRILGCVTGNEGFEPSQPSSGHTLLGGSGEGIGKAPAYTGAVLRGMRDLNPRAGHPTYTLSRGASSAS